MLNPQRQGGWGQAPNPPTNPFGNPSSAQLVNPFATPKVNPFSQTQPNAAAPPSNPFQPKQIPSGPGQAGGEAKQGARIPSEHARAAAPPNGRSASNPFDPKPNPFSGPNNAQSSNTRNPFSAPAAVNGVQAPSSSPFGQPAPGSKFASFGQPSFTQASNSTVGSKNNSSAPNPFSKQMPSFAGENAASTTSNTNGLKKPSDYVQPAWPKQGQSGANPVTAATRAPASRANGKRKSENDVHRRNKFSRNSPDPQVASIRSHSPAQNSNQDSALENGMQGKPRIGQDRDEFARKILNQLAKDKIRPPRWPENPGSHAQRHAMDRFRESYKAYREKARKSLTRAGLIDDPDKKRRLDEALVFKGICEDMCPEWEQITRIVEHDIKVPEKSTDENGELVATPSLMVKRLARSAAGQDAPLPMDVRSVRMLRNTLDYLIDLVSSDDLLPQRHSFLWDRTRAIRIDFSFQKYAMTSDEIKDQIYCLETIARFHVTSLHLLSKEGSTPTDFSEQQEVEQLSKTLISLMEVYDDCRHQGIKCENEPEFRGYFIVFNAYNPGLMERIDGWDHQFAGTDGIKSAVAIVQCIDNIRKLQGPLSPEAYSPLAVDVISIFFKLIAQPSVSYTMACFAEIHFNSVRKGIVKVIRKAFSRPRYGPKDLTPPVLKQYLCTDTEEEAVKFFKDHGFQFHDDGYAILNPSPEFVDSRVPHSFSGDIVERKRSGRALPEVIRSTVFEDNNATTASVGPSLGDRISEEEDSLFVSDSQDVSPTDSNNRKYEAINNEPTLNAHPAQQTFGSHLAIGSTSSSPFTQPPALSFSNVGSAPENQSPTSIFAQYGRDAKTPTASFPSFNSAGAVPPAPSGQPHASIFSQASDDIGSKALNTISPNSPRTTPFNNAANAQANTEATKQAHTESSITQPPLPNAKKVTFGDVITIGQASAPTNNVAAPDLFSSQLRQGGDKHATVSPSTAFNSAPFSALLPNTSDPSKKDGLQASTPQVAPTTQTPGPNAFGSLQPASAPPTSSLFSSDQLSTISEAGERPPPTQPSIFKHQATGPSLASQQSNSANISTPRNTVQSDPMRDFTRWFVCGDRGLMESQLEEFAIRSILESVWDEFHTAEIERKRREEEEKLETKIRNFRENVLRVKYFYRWHDGFRKRQRIRRMKEEKEKARQWRLPANVAKRERAAKEEQERIIQETKDSMLRRSQNKVNGTAQLRASTARASIGSGLELSSPHLRAQSVEDALLATGIFKGVKDEKAAARFAASDFDVAAQTDVLLEKKMRLRSENRSRLARGLRPLKELPEPKAYKGGSKTAMLRARCLGNDGDSMSVSSGSLRNSTFSSSYRSSVGYKSSRVTKPRSRVSDPYWALKARGLVRMPNGEFLHESIALPMLQKGERIPGFGDYGLPAAKPTTPSQSPPPPMSGFSSPPMPTNELQRSRLSSTSSAAESQKRKRHADGDASPNGIELSTGVKRARNGDARPNSLVNADEHLADIASFMEMVEGRVSELRFPS